MKNFIIGVSAFLGFNLLCGGAQASLLSQTLAKTGCADLKQNRVLSQVDSEINLLNFRRMTIQGILKEELKRPTSAEEIKNGLAAIQYEVNARLNFQVNESPNTHVAQLKKDSGVQEIIDLIKQNNALEQAVAEQNRVSRIFQAKPEDQDAVLEKSARLLSEVLNHEKMQWEQLRVKLLEVCPRLI